MTEPHPGYSRNIAVRRQLHHAPIKKPRFNISNRLKIIVGIIIVFLIVMSLINKTFIGTFICFLLGAVSMIHKRLVKGLPIGIELAVMSTCIISKAQGPIVGAIFGLSTAIAAQIVANDFDGGMIFYFAGTTLAGFIAYYLPFYLVIVVIMMVLMNDLFTQFVPLLGPSYMKLSAGTYIVTHLIINIAVLQVFGQYLLALATP